MRTDVAPARSFFVPICSARVIDFDATTLKVDISEPELGGDNSMLRCGEVPLSRSFKVFGASLPLLKKISKDRLRFRLAGERRSLDPAIGLGRVLLDVKPVGKQTSDGALSMLPIPLTRARHPTRIRLTRRTAEINQAELELRIRVTLLRSALKPISGIGRARHHALATSIEEADLVVCFGAAFFARCLPAIERF